MNVRKLLQTLRHAEKYPLLVRIAAAMHLQGITLAEYHAISMQPDTMDREFRQLPYPLINNLYLALSDIEHGRTVITQQLRSYAERIKL